MSEAGKAAEDGVAGAREGLGKAAARGRSLVEQQHKRLA